MITPENYSMTSESQWELLEPSNKTYKGVLNENPRKPLRPQEARKNYMDPKSVKHLDLTEEPLKPANTP